MKALIKRQIKIRMDITMAITNELRETIKLMQGGSEEAFGNFYQNTYPYVYAKAKYIMHNEEDALDLTQETFIQAYRGIGAIADVENVYAWLGGIVYRQGMKIFNKKKELLTGEDQEYVFDDLVAEDATPEQTVEMQATANIVQGMIEELPELQRVAVMAFYYDNMKIDDIASMCDCSSNTIKSRLNYAKKFLREKVEVHQKQNNYKLCSLSPALLLFVFKSLFGKESYQMSAQAAESVYALTCGKLGIGPVALSGTASGAAASVVGETATATGGTAATVGTATVAAASTGLGLKIAAIVGAVLLVGTGIGFGSYKAIKYFTEDESTSVDVSSDNNSNMVAVNSETEDTETADTVDDSTDGDASDDSSTTNVSTGNQTEYVSNINIQINISNEREFYDAGDGYVDMEIVQLGDDGTEVDSAFEQNVQFIDGRTTICMISNQNVRYDGDIYRFEDGSMITYLTVTEPGNVVYDLGDTYYAPIFVTNDSQKMIQNTAFEEASYMGKGCNVDIKNVDGDFFDVKIGVRTIDANTFVADSEGDFQLQNVNGVVQFSMSTSAGTIIRGYMYKNADGDLVFNYLEYDGGELKSYSSSAYILKKM